MKRLIFCALTLALAGPALAQADSNLNADGRPAALTVRHNDLDLSTSRGAKIMIHRLDEAASAVCGGTSFSAREYKQALHSTPCYQDSMNRAVASLGSPTVNALYREHTLSVASK